MNDPLVSVIINTHNGAKYLKEAINSVYAQTYGNFEIILYDNNSTDETPLIAREYDNRLKYVRSDSFLMLGTARNGAIEHSNGQYICFLDSDDMFLPEKIAKQVASFSPGVGMVYANVYMISEKLSKEEVYFKRKLPSGKIFRYLIGDYCISMASAMISREALGSDRSKWFAEQLTFAEDADLFMRVAFAYDAVYINEPLSRFRIHGGNFTLKHPDVAIKEKEILLERLRIFIPHFDEMYAKEITCYKGWLYKNKAMYEWQKGNRNAAVVNYWHSFQCLGRGHLLLEALAALFISFNMLKKIRGW